jgi:ATP synthase protein I
MWIPREVLSTFSNASIVMSYASALLGSGMRRLLVWQAAIVLLIGALVWIRYGRPHGLSLLYGGGLAMIVSALLGWRLQKINASASMMTGFGVMHIYLGAVERFLFVAVGMGAGMGWLRLPPFPMIVGFAAAQAGYLFKLPEHPTGNTPRRL